MNLRFIDWIWHVRGTLTLAPEQSGKEAFDRLDPLFRQTGTSHERTNDTLVFRKKDQAAQDKMSVFNSGVLKIEKGTAGSVLHYDLISRALLYCFLAPLLFLSIAGFTIAIGKFEKPSTETEEKKAEKVDKILPMNPIDKALGAPAPEKPKKDKEKEKDKGKDKKPSPTPAYVFAAIFAVLFIAGRILEPWLIKSVFRKRLSGDDLTGREIPLAQ